MALRMTTMIGGAIDEVDELDAVADDGGTVAIGLAGGLVGIVG
jgi:hypothetical protein